jgi:septal ring factor EnvC (AmiA/AmiB activator)
MRKTTGGNLMERNDAYVAKLKKQLDEWNAELNQWQVKAQKSSADIRQIYEDQIASLTKQKDHLSDKLTQLQSSSTEAGGDLRRGVDESWLHLKEAFNRARSRF